MSRDMKAERSEHIAAWWGSLSTTQHASPFDSFDPPPDWLIDSLVDAGLMDFNPDFRMFVPMDVLEFVESQQRQL